MNYIFLFFLLLVLLSMVSLLVYIMGELFSGLYTNFFLSAPYVPNKKFFVREALILADAKKGDVLCDLGSGDGRVLAMGLKDFEVKKAIGYEVDPVQSLKSVIKLRSFGFGKDQYEVIGHDLYTADVSKVSLLYLYLYPEMLQKVVNCLFAQLPNGARVVSCRFAIPNMEPVETKKYGKYEIYLYKV